MVKQKAIKQILKLSQCN